MANRRPRKPRPIRKPRREHRINHEIRIPEVRLVGMEVEEENGVVSTSQALRMADEMELDLVEIAPQARPPVVRIMDYSKFAYELKKKKKANKAKQHTTVMKEIRFGPNTDDHDFNFKLKHAQKFLEDGNKLKAYVQFRGRNIIYKDRGRDVLRRFAESLEDLGKIEQMPTMEGRRMIMIMGPAKSK
ncbi:MAG: translation initiation factor IF-3 [Bacteroidota bacterium]